MRDSPAACATLGVNLLATKLAVFGSPRRSAGFAGAVAGVHFGNVQTTNFDLLMGLEGAGLAVLLLLVVGGVAVVSGAVFGSTLLLLFTKFLPIVWFADFKPIQWWSKVGPGLAGVGIATNPEGVIPQVGHDVRERRTRKRGNGPPPVTVAQPVTATEAVVDAPPTPAGRS